MAMSYGRLELHTSTTNLANTPSPHTKQIFSAVIIAANRGEFICDNETLECTWRPTDNSLDFNSTQLRQLADELDRRNNSENRVAELEAALKRLQIENAKIIEELRIQQQGLYAQQQGLYAQQQNLYMSNTRSYDPQNTQGLFNKFKNWAK